MQRVTGHPGSQPLCTLLPHRHHERRINKHDTQAEEVAGRDRQVRRAKVARYGAARQFWRFCRGEVGLTNRVPATAGGIPACCLRTLPTIARSDIIMWCRCASVQLAVCRVPWQWECKVRSSSPKRPNLGFQTPHCWHGVAHVVVSLPP